MEKHQEFVFLGSWSNQHSLEMSCCFSVRQKEHILACLPCSLCILALECPLEFPHYHSFIPPFFMTMRRGQVYQTSHPYFWRPGFPVSCLLSLVMTREGEFTLIFTILQDSDSLWPWWVFFALCLVSLSMPVQDLPFKRTSVVNIGIYVLGKSVKF